MIDWLRRGDHAHTALAASPNTRSHTTPPRPLPRTRTVAASKPIIFSFVYQHGAAGFTDYTTCIATQSFVPAAGARYRADFRTSGDRCAVLVTREDGSDPMAVEALHPIEPACFNTING